MKKTAAVSLRPTAVSDCNHIEVSPATDFFLQCGFATIPSSTEVALGLGGKPLIFDYTEVKSKTPHPQCTEIIGLKTYVLY